MKVFSVFDVAAEAFGIPMFFKTRGEALRGFIDVASDKSTGIGKHPQCFTLFELGDFDECTGLFSLHASPVSCGLALELISGSTV